MKIVVMGDRLVSSETLKEAAYSLHPNAEVLDFDWHNDVSKDVFQGHIKDIELNGPENQEIPINIIEALQDADMFLLHYGPVSREMVKVMKKGAIVGVCRGGLENVNYEACKDNEIKLIHVIRNANPVAEFTVGLMLDATRNISRSFNSIKEGRWDKSFANDAYRTTLSGQTIGLLGLGYIGKLVIEKLKGFGCKIIAHDPYVNKESLGELLDSIELVDFDTLISTSDILSLHARVTESTTNIISHNVFDKMKESSYIINTARPELIEKESFVDALRDKKIIGAAIDVTWQEPVSTDDPLLKLDNLTITTHIAGDTVDAIPKSPFLLAQVIKDYYSKGTSDMLIK